MTTLDAIRKRNRNRMFREAIVFRRAAEVAGSVRNAAKLVKIASKQ